LPAEKTDSGSRRQTSATHRQEIGQARPALAIDGFHRRIFIADAKQKTRQDPERGFPRVLVPELVLPDDREKWTIWPASRASAHTPIIKST